MLLLYTDGITEAARDGVMFDLSGVQRALEELGERSAEEIVSGLLAALTDHVVADDLTALAIKQG